ncbi:hypothetical protein D3C80_2075610 [compost metagenome]
MFSAEFAVSCTQIGCVTMIASAVKTPRACTESHEIAAMGPPGRPVSRMKWSMRR